MDKMVYRQQPPPDDPARDLTMPEPAALTLSNGLKVIYVNHGKAPMAQIRLLLPKAGKRFDPVDRYGLAAASARLLTAGTETKTSFQIEEEADRYGGSIGVSANSDYASLYASCLSQYLPNMLALMTDLLLNAVYPEREVDLDRVNTLQRLQIQRSQPAFLAQERFAWELFGAHPYGRIAPDPEAVKHWSSEELQAFQASYYRPKGATLILVGDLPARQLSALLEDYLGVWIGAPRKEAEPAAPAPRQKGTRQYVERPNSVQSYIRMGVLCPTRLHRDYIALKVATTLLGGGASSRLFLTVREQSGYAYSVGCSTESYQQTGVFSADAQTATVNTEDAIRQMVAETRKMSQKLAPEEELQAVKNYMLGRFALSWITQAGIADMVARLQVNKLSFDYWLNYPQKLREVSTQSVQAVSQRYLNPSAFQTVVVG